MKDNHVEFLNGLEYLQLNDSQFSLWQKHKNAFLSSDKIEFNTVLKHLSLSPKAFYPQFLLLKKKECTLRGNLLYYNNEIYDFYAVSDLLKVFLADRLNEIENDDLIWRISPLEFETQWESICQKLNVSIQLKLLQRFASWNLLSEGLPFSLISSHDKKYNVYGATQLNLALTRYRQFNKSVSDEYWRTTLDYLRFRFKGRQPWLNAAQIKMDLFGRVSNSLDTISEYSHAVLIAALLVLSRCPSFKDLRNTRFLLNGEEKSLSQFNDADFCVDQEKARKFLLVQKKINKKSRASSDVICST